MSHKSDLEAQRAQLQQKLDQAGTAAGKAKLKDRLRKNQIEIDACSKEAPAATRKTATAKAKKARR